MKRIITVCSVGTCALLSLLSLLSLRSIPTPALGASGVSEIKPLTPNEATEWRLGGFGGPGSTERPATLYEVPRCINGDTICPGVVVIFWTSYTVRPRPTVIQTLSSINHVYRTGLNTYRLDVTTGSVGLECTGGDTPAYCAHALHYKTLLVNTWTRTVTG